MKDIPNLNSHLTFQDIVKKISDIKKSKGKLI